MPDARFERVAILGLGLMGGSLALALRRRGFRGELRGSARRPETRRLAEEAGTFDAVCGEAAEACRGADLAVACVPVGAIPALLRSCADALPAGAAVTDVGSTKGWLAREAPAALGRADVAFVGSHPIAGSERQGWEAASPKLYENAVAVVTPGPGAPPDAVARVEALWRAVGAQTVRMDAAEHDRRLARTSHLPHLAAAVLAATVGRDGPPGELAPFCGSGFRDSTRVADGAPEVWMDIVASNREALAEEAAALAAAASDLAAALRRGDDDAVRAARTRPGGAARARAAAGRGRDAGRGEAGVSEKVDSVSVAPAGAFGGEVRVPGDKSISHRVALLAGIAGGESPVRNFLRSEDCLNTLRAMEALGARAHFHDDGTLLHIGGNGGRFLQPVGELDMGNSGTGLRLLAGLLAGQPVEATLTGDASLRSRPMDRIREPLQRMGATVELLGPGGRAPVRVKGGRLKPLMYDLPVASAQVKSCILLAALYAEGLSVVREPAATRDHTERLLAALGVPVETAGNEVRLQGLGPAGPTVKAREWTVPGDLSSAAFWLVAAAARPGAALTARGVGLNPRRTAVLDVLGRMGARIERRAETGSADWEPSGDVTVRGAVLRGTEIGGAEIANLIDELPVLAVAAALAEGETVIRDARELRVKESDRIATMCANLKLMGVDVEERPDGMVVRGPARLVESAALRSQGDHRVAMAMAVLALSGPAPSVVNEVACVDTSYPGFWADLLRLSGRAAEAAG